MPDEQVEHAVDRRPGEGVVASRSGHEPHEDGLIAGDERRHAEDAVTRHRGLVLLAQHLEGPTGGELGEDLVVVDAS